MTQIAEPGNALALVVEKAQLPANHAQSILEDFGPLVIQREDLFKVADGLCVTDSSQVSVMKKCRTTRLELRQVRIESDKKRKKHKEIYRRGADAVDAIGHAVIDPIEAVEAKLEAMEKFAEREEARLKQERLVARTVILMPYDFDFELYDIGGMSESQFTQLHQQFIALKAENDRKAKEEESARVAAELKRLAEESRIREENARLQQEAEAAQRAAREAKAAAEAQRVAAESALRAKQQAADAAARKAQEAHELVLANERRAAAEAARIAADAARKEREAAEEQTRVERKAREAAEQEAITAKQRAHMLQKQQEAKAAKAKADEEQARKKAAAAPEREKLERYALRLAEVEQPKMDSEDGKLALDDISRRVEQLNQYIRQSATAL